MPIEIRELIVRAQIEPAPPSFPDAREAELVPPASREAIIQEVLERVEQMLARKYER